MTEESQIILEGSQALFLSRGFRTVTLDDIAKELKISKKTIYKFYKDKEELVNAVVSSHLACAECEVLESTAACPDAIQEMLGMVQCISRLKQDVQPSIIFELEKYFPSSYKLIQIHKENFVKRLIIQNIEKGIKTGLYRENLKPDFIAAIYLGSSQVIIEGDLIKNMSEGILLLNHFFEYHLRGIASPKGLELINKLNLS